MPKRSASWLRDGTCDLSVTAVTGPLRDLLACEGNPLPQAVRAVSDPYALLRFILAACPRLAARAEAEICQQEVLAAAAARPSHGIRNLLDGPASVSIIGDVCPAAITGYLARLYPRQMGRVRLITGRLGADPALLEPTPVPILQAAQLLGCRPRRAPWWPSSQAPPTPPNCACGAAAGRADDRDHPGQTSPRAAAHGAWGARSRKSAPFK